MLVELYCEQECCSAHSQRWSVGSKRRNRLERVDLGKAQRARYDDVFRAGAVYLVLVGRRTVADVSRELDLNPETLRRWVIVARDDVSAVPPFDTSIELVRLARRVQLLEGGR